MSLLNTQYINVGFKTYVPLDTIDYILDVSEQRYKRLNIAMKKDGMIKLDATRRRKCRSLIITKDKMGIQSAFPPEYLLGFNIDDEIPDKLREQDKVEKAKGRVRWYKWRLEHGLATEEEYRRACEEAKTLGIQKETEA
jgi:regulator of extracellular matrix RemA (YlzA/DUF370 family)|nr:MAG TPA: protein of unknown function (DUF370) [Caudoviricetes sp.]